MTISFFFYARLKSAHHHPLHQYAKSTFHLFNSTFSNKCRNIIANHRNMISRVPSISAILRNRRHEGLRGVLPVEINTQFDEWESITSKRASTAELSALKPNCLEDKSLTAHIASPSLLPMSFLSIFEDLHEACQLPITVVVLLGLVLWPPSGLRCNKPQRYQPLLSEIHGRCKTSLNIYQTKAYGTRVVTQLHVSRPKISLPAWT